MFDDGFCGARFYSEPDALLTDDAESQSPNSNGLGILFGDTVEKNGDMDVSSKQEQQEPDAPDESEAPPAVEEVIVEAPQQNGTADDEDPFGDVFGDGASSPVASADAVGQAPLADGDSAAAAAAAQ